eukprot:1147937-Pelagomonas_calceolata.AAC.3
MALNTPLLIPPVRSIPARLPPRGPRMPQGRLLQHEARRTQDQALSEFQVWVGSATATAPAPSACSTGCFGCTLAWAWSMECRTDHIWRCKTAVLCRLKT